jgi:site-specific DNA-methyltransferase (adenine-specific)
MRPYFGDGQITIFHARWEDVWPTLGLKHEDVALLWADPPYGIRLNTKRDNSGRGRGSDDWRGRNWAPVHGDDAPFDPTPLLEFSVAVLWGANHYASRLPDTQSWWLWDKREDLIPERTQADGELAWTTLNGPLRIFRHFWDGFARASERGHEHLHPTQKPVALATWGFQRAKLKPGGLVFSPYMGSGPEARAALDMGLRFVGCEVVEDYCRAAVNRLKQLPLL